MAKVISYTIEWTMAIWMWCGLTVWLYKRDLKVSKSIVKVCSNVYYEVKPFVLTLIVIKGIITLTSYGVLVCIIDTAINLFAYRVATSQMDDDDRWKKRRKKLAEKVESLGHRLVVVHDSA